MSNNLFLKSISVFTTNWGLLFVNFISSVLVARALGAEGKGTVTLLTSGAILLAALGQLGIQVAAVFFLRQERFYIRELIANAFLFFVLVSAIYFIVFTALQDIFLAIFFEEVIISHWEIFFIISLIPIIMFGDFLNTLVVGRGDTQIFAIVSGISSLLNLLFVTGSLLVGLGVGGVLGALMLSQLARLFGLLRWLISESKSQNWRISWGCLSALLNYGMRHYIGSIGSLVFKRADTFIIAHFIGIQAVGHFSVALGFYNMLLSIPRSISTLVAGEASDHLRGDSSMMIARAASYIVWIMLIVVFPFGMLMYWVIPVIYGIDFLPAILPLLLLLPAAVMMGYSGTLYLYLLSIDRPATGGIITLVAGAFNLAFSFLFVPEFGLLGAASATLLGATVQTILQSMVFAQLSESSWTLSIKPPIIELKVHLKSIRDRL